jgi:hypothetical protein
MNADPFWRRSGFWTAIGTTISALIVVMPEWEVWLKASAVIATAWGTFFTAAAMRPSVGRRRVDEEASRVSKILVKQSERIKVLEQSGR